MNDVSQSFQNIWELQCLWSLVLVRPQTFQSPIQSVFCYSLVLMQTLTSQNSLASFVLCLFSICLLYYGVWRLIYALCRIPSFTCVSCVCCVHIMVRPLETCICLPTWSKLSRTTEIRGGSRESMDPHHQTTEVNLSLWQIAICQEQSLSTQIFVLSIFFPFLSICPKHY